MVLQYILHVLGFFFIWVLEMCGGLPTQVCVLYVMHITSWVVLMFHNALLLLYRVAVDSLFFFLTKRIIFCL